MDTSNDWLQVSSVLNSLLVWFRFRRDPKALSAPLTPAGGNGTHINVTHGGTLIINQAPKPGRRRQARRRRK